MSECAAREHTFSPRQLREKSARERRAVAVTDRGLHGEHRGNAAAQQGLGEAGGLPLVDGAMAGVQEHQRSGVARGAQRIEQVLGGRLDRVAVLVVELERAGRAVTGDVEDVVLVALERLADR